MSSRFQYRASLVDTPLPKMLVTISRYRVPGVLTARLKEIEKRIFLRGGDVVFATSNDLTDSLGAYLVKKKLLGRDQLEESAARRLKAGGMRHGDVLIAMGVLSQEQVSSAVAAQVTNILWTLFDWEEGDVTFEIGEFRADEKIQISIPLLDVIREGIVKVADAKGIVRRIGPSWTVLEKVPGAVAGIALNPDEDLYLTLVDGKTPFVDLCRKGPGDIARSARLIYLFLCLDLVRRKADSSAKKIQWKTEGGKKGS